MPSSGQFMNSIATQGEVDRILGPYAIAWCLELYLAGYAHSSAVALIRESRPSLFHKQPSSKSAALGGWFLVAASFGLFVAVVFTMVQLFHYATLQKGTLGDYYSWQVYDALSFLPVASVAAIAQTYFALRVYKFYGSAGKWAAIPLGFFIVCTFAAAMNLMGHLLRDQGRSESYLKISMAVWLWLIALTDMCIWALLMFKLKYFRRTDRLASTESLISRMIRLTFVTAAPTAFLGAAAAIAEAATGRDPTSVNVYPIFEKLLPAAYVLCLVFSIKSREERRETLGPSTPAQCISASSATPLVAAATSPLGSSVSYAQSPPLSTPVSLIRLQHPGDPRDLEEK